MPVLNMSLPECWGGHRCFSQPLSTSPPPPRDPWVSVKFPIQLWPGSGRMGGTLRFTVLCVQRACRLLLLCLWFMAEGSWGDRGQGSEHKRCPLSLSDQRSQPRCSPNSGIVRSTVEVT